MNSEFLVSVVVCIFLFYILFFSFRDNHRKLLDVDFVDDKQKKSATKGRNLGGTGRTHVEISRLDLEILLPC